MTGENTIIVLNVFLLEFFKFVFVKPPSSEKSINTEKAYGFKNYV